MIWYNTPRKPFGQSEDWEAESDWALETGFTKCLFIGYQPCDLTRFIQGRRRRSVNCEIPPCAFDHLTLYKNPVTNKKIAIFHEYPESAEKKLPAIVRWVEENGLSITEMEYSWYYPGVTKAYMIQANGEEKTK